MPRLSKKTMFAIEAVLDVAFHVGEHPVRSGDITERQRIPKRYLEQVLAQPRVDSAHPLGAACTKRQNAHVTRIRGSITP